MARKRDYQAEYRRRIERGLTRGLSRSQARGHPARAEASASGARAVEPTPELEAALKSLRRGSTQKSDTRSTISTPMESRSYARPPHMGWGILWQATGRTTCPMGLKCPNLVKP